MASFEIIHHITALETREAHETGLHTECACQPASRKPDHIPHCFLSRYEPKYRKNADEKNSLIFITLTLSLSWGGRRWLSMKAVNLSPEHLSGLPPPMPLSLQRGLGGVTDVPLRLHSATVPSGAAHRFLP